MNNARTLTGRHVLLALIAFFGVIIVANTIFITLAVKSFPGESEKKSYMQGLRYNDVLAERATQSALGWNAAVTRIKLAETGGFVEISMLDGNGDELLHLNIEGALKRPAHDGEDSDLAFEELGGGAYRARTMVLTAGAWDLEARATNAAGEQFDISSRIIIE